MMIGDVQADKKPLDQGGRGHKENDWSQANKSREQIHVFGVPALLPGGKWSLEVERRIDGTWELCQDIDWL
jgi:hypothetical protein